MSYPTNCDVLEIAEFCCLLKVESCHW